MPRTVAVEYHVVPGVPFAVGSVFDDVLLAFRTCGIELVVVQGEPLTTEPELGGLWSFKKLVDKYSAGPRKSGQIIVARVPRDRRDDVAGELLDLERRGVAAVYINSSYISREGVLGLAQTLAHEIGHMMNLSHDDTSSAFTSAMAQAHRRDGGLDVAWTAAADEARRLQQHGDQAYFQQPIRPVNCYPFAHAARMILNSWSDALISPWGGRFERRDNGLNDRSEAGRGR